MKTDTESLDRLIDELDGRVKALEDGIRYEVGFIQAANESGIRDSDETIADCCVDLINLADSNSRVDRS